ncbi:Csac_0668 family 2Fe-2S cluster-binding (seleno)protein [Gudongella sp. SC589]|uniref:Csac_0668 family 2Fe-2S cluster-binding (seleno)protein n=1 Tax=Gudongella sp. SC589 TaxID=3385990 RepID=UPI003904AF1F
MSENKGCSCCGNIVDLSMTSKDINKCPICKQEGKKVKNTTVRHLVKEEYELSVGSANYYICMNENCDTVYYSENNEVVFCKEQIKVPIWFKKDAEPQYACYCSEVTIDQVKEAVRSKGARKMKDVLAITGAMRNSNCEIKNPLGVCCHEAIQQAIDEAFAE